MSSKTNSGIQTASDGSAFIPASRRADGSVRKEIKVRPGFKPSEDIATYKTPTPAAWKDRKAGGVPGADVAPKATEPEPMSKNAKRREAARKKAASSPSEEDQLAASMQDSGISEINKLKADWRDLSRLAVNDVANDREAEKLKKIRNTLKKLKAVRELKEKKSAGEKLSPDQLMKIAKESELVRDLEKLGYEKDETAEAEEPETEKTNGELASTQGG